MKKRTRSYPSDKNREQTEYVGQANQEKPPANSNDSGEEADFGINTNLNKKIGTNYQQQSLNMDERQPMN